MVGQIVGAAVHRQAYETSGSRIDTGAHVQVLDEISHSDQGWRNWSGEEADRIHE